MLTFTQLCGIRKISRFKVNMQWLTSNYYDKTKKIHRDTLLVQKTLLEKFSNFAVEIFLEFATKVQQKIGYCYYSKELGCLHSGILPK